MLVLTRKPGEKIQLGNDITLTVLEVGGGRIRLGIDAEPWVPIRRGELPADLHLAQDEGVLTGNEATAKNPC
jgi:carbon storage regulator